MTKSIIIYKKPQTFGLQTAYMLAKAMPPNTTSLELSFEDPITQTELETLFKFIQNKLPTLQELSISTTKPLLLREHYNFIAYFLYKTPKISKLKISSNLADLLRGALHIKELTIKDESYLDASKLKILDLLPKLESLKLLRAPYTTEGQKLILKLLQLKPKLSLEFQEPPANNSSEFAQIVQLHQLHHESMEKMLILSAYGKKHKKSKPRLPAELLQVTLGFILGPNNNEERPVERPIIALALEKAVMNDRNLEVTTAYINMLKNLEHKRISLKERYKNLYGILHGGIYRKDALSIFDEEDFFPDLGFADLGTLFIFPILIFIGKFFAKIASFLETYKDFFEHLIIGFVLMPLVFYCCALIAAAALKQIFIGLALVVLTPFVLIAHSLEACITKNETISAESIFKVPVYPSLTAALEATPAAEG